MTVLQKIIVPNYYVISNSASHFISHSAHQSFAKQFEQCINSRLFPSARVQTFQTKIQRIVIALCCIIIHKRCELFLEGMSVTNCCFSNQTQHHRFKAWFRLEHLNFLRSRQLFCCRIPIGVRIQQCSNCIVIGIGNLPGSPFATCSAPLPRAFLIVTESPQPRGT